MLLLAKKLARNILGRIELLRVSFVSNHTDSELVLVTGADSTHCKTLNQFLSSLYVYEPNIKVIVMDLGLSQSERQQLQEHFPNAELRLFDYSKYPDYFNIKINAGEYAWKPIIIQQILNEFKCCVCWMDAGNLIIKPLSFIRKITKKAGFYSPFSSGRIVDWTHPKTLEFLNSSNKLLNKRNLNGACIAINYQNSVVMNVINQWADCATQKDCIAPIGSSRKNHRQDQAVLSVLAHQSGIIKNMRHVPTSYHGFICHKDID